MTVAVLVTEPPPADCAASVYVVVAAGASCVLPAAATGAPSRVTALAPVVVHVSVVL